MRRTSWVLVLAIGLAACTSPGVVGPSSATVPSAAVPVPAASTFAPDTVIDGYVLGKPRGDCPASNPECAKVLDLVQSATLDSAAGRAAIAACTLIATECAAFTGQPATPGSRKSAGIGEIVGLGESEVLAQNTGLDPAHITRFSLYSESLAPYIGSDGQWLAHRTGDYDIVVFTLGDGSVHAAGVGCVFGTCHATR